MSNILLEISSKQFISNIRSVKKNKAYIYVVSGMDDRDDRCQKKFKVSHEIPNLFIYLYKECNLNSAKKLNNATRFLYSQEVDNYLFQIYKKTLEEIIGKMEQNIHINDKIEFIYQESFKNIKDSKNSINKNVHRYIEQLFIKIITFDSLSNYDSMFKHVVKYFPNVKYNFLRVCIVRNIDKNAIIKSLEITDSEKDIDKILFDFIENGNVNVDVCKIAIEIAIRKKIKFTQRFTGRFIENKKLSTINKINYGVTFHSLIKSGLHIDKEITEVAKIIKENTYKTFALIDGANVIHGDKKFIHYLINISKEISTFGFSPIIIIPTRFVDRNNQKYIIELKKYYNVVETRQGIDDDDVWVNSAITWDIPYVTNDKLCGQINESTDKHLLKTFKETHHISYNPPNNYKKTYTFNFPTQLPSFSLSYNGKNLLWGLDVFFEK